MKKNIIYITFVDFDNLTSGSSVRPAKIYNSLIEKGFDVSLLTGLQNRKLERWKNVFKFMGTILGTSGYEFCYVEPPSGPIFNFCDHLLLLLIRLKGIPTGLFYRDAYWKFADWYSKKGIKRKIINAMHRFDWFIFKRTCDTIFFPSESMGDLFKFEKKFPLPPACEDNILSSGVEDFRHNVIYVGGVSESYGGKLLLQSFEKLNRVKNIHLHLVCRKDEQEAIKEYVGSDWLHLYSASGKQLEDIYKKCDAALIPRKKDFYMDFSMPVKLFEYLGYGLPVIVTNCNEMAKFVTRNEVGLVCEDDADDLANTILKLYEDKNSYDKLKSNVIKTTKSNLWANRVEFIEEVLTCKEKK